MNDQPEFMGDERTVIEGMLESNRASLVACVEGLTESDARRSLVPSLTTPLGILKHAAAVERSWFQRRLAALPETEWDGYGFGDDDSWRLAESDSLPSLVAEYWSAVGRSRAIAAQHHLDDTFHHDARGTVSVRWLLLHMIEELARHAGHADILREMIDGRTAS